MKLDYNNVRTLLLHFEENLSLDDRYDIVELELPEIDNEAIIYTTKKLIEAGYIRGKAQYASNKIYLFPISSITWDGHEFLNTIRDPEIFNEAIQNSISKVGSVSLEILGRIATSLINSKLGI